MPKSQRNQPGKSEGDPCAFSTKLQFSACFVALAKEDLDEGGLVGTVISQPATVGRATPAETSFNILAGDVKRYQTLGHPMF
mmetsp:Transcript_29108/g.63254  ORF Transcript_29108/g.63254 Transcript_29108/m.63254 type:complete len:82 (-) Transcript_29108:30-275(-)